MVIREARVFDLVLGRMRARVRAGDYIVTLHAYEELLADGLDAFDLERCILSGTIFERQWDPFRSEWKYVVVGTSCIHRWMNVVAKLGPTGTLVIITAYLA